MKQTVNYNTIVKHRTSFYRVVITFNEEFIHSLSLFMSVIKIIYLIACRLFLINTPWENNLSDFKSDNDSRTIIFRTRKIALEYYYL